jgi:hypothetical protein
VQGTTVTLRAKSAVSTAGIGNPLVSTLELIGSVITAVLAILALILCLVLIGFLFIRIDPGENRIDRGDIRIQDKDQVVAQVENVSIPRGSNDFQFPYTRYTFRGLDHYFTVLVDFERTPSPVDAAREFCAKPMGWTLRP